MRQCFFRAIQKHLRAKNSGATLIVSVILSGLILTIGLGLSRTLSQELKFSSDLIFSEKAYFGAESGVEAALLELKEHPVQHRESSELLSAGEMSGTAVHLEIQNKKETFDFVLPGGTSAKFRLQQDVDETGEYEPESVREFSFTSGENWDKAVQWKIQCENPGDVTEALIGKTGNGPLFPSSSGRRNTELQQTIQFFLNTQTDENTCFLTLINTSTNPFFITAGSFDPTMAPLAAQVRATGKTSRREKVVQFLYRQKNLSPFFDFGLLHREED